MFRFLSFTLTIEHFTEVTDTAVTVKVINQGFLATLLVSVYLAKLVRGKTFLNTGSSVFFCEPETVYHHSCTEKHPDVEETNTFTKLQETHGKPCSQISARFKANEKNIA